MFWHLVAYEDSSFEDNYISDDLSVSKIKNMVKLKKYFFYDEYNYVAIFDLVLPIK